MRQNCSAAGAASNRGYGLLFSYLLTCCVLLGLICSSACTGGSAGQSPADTGVQQGTAVTPGPVPPAAPVEPAPAPVVPAPVQPNPPSPPSSAASIDPAMLITRQASLMTLTLSDMGAGWAKGVAIAPAIGQVTSSSHVSYTQGSSYAPGVQNTVAVYRSIAFAESSFAREKQANAYAQDPGIGDECFLNASVPINMQLVFRKNNVVVWVWLKQYKDGDIERYARLVEQKVIAAAAPPVTIELPSTTVLTPPQQVPAEPPAEFLAKPADGMITRQAYQMVLTKDDLGMSWIKGNISPPPASYSLSSSHVSYSQGANFAPTVQNSVVVYRSIEAAVKAYDTAKPSGPSVSSPAIGDACFLNGSVPIDRLLVFRKANVVAWVWLKQYKTGDIEGYARIVEKRVTP